MKARLAAVLLGLALLAAPGQESLPRDPANLSIRNEVQLAIDKASGWLAKEQHADGSWADPAQTALTALPLLAVLGNPQRPDRPREALDSVRRALEALRRQAHPDGSIGGPTAPLLNTAVSLAALQRANLPEDDALVAAARAYLLAHQDGEGGFGDLVTTAFVVDALQSAGALPASAAEGVRRYVRACERPDGDGFSLVPRGSAGSTATSAALLALELTAPLPEPAAPGRTPAGIGEASMMVPFGGAPGRQAYLFVKAMGAAHLTVGAADLALVLINSQTSAGTWVDKHAPSADPVEVTSYGVLVLELLYGRL